MYTTSEDQGPPVIDCLVSSPCLLNLHQQLNTYVVKAERAERSVVMQEEEDHKEQQRQNFNNMVTEARAEAAKNPPPPHDPMRFRAVPPGNLL